MTSSEYTIVDLDLVMSGVDPQFVDGNVYQSPNGAEYRLLRRTESMVWFQRATDEKVFRKRVKKTFNTDT